MIDWHLGEQHFMQQFMVSRPLESHMLFPSLPTHVSRTEISLPTMVDGSGLHLPEPILNQHSESSIRLRSHKLLVRTELSFAIGSQSSHIYQIQASPVASTQNYSVTNQPRIR
jgi:hypothetical protein